MRGLSIWFVLISTSILAQFDPAGGLPGSRSIHRQDPAIYAWADTIDFHPGWLQINDTAKGKVNSASDLALGEADGRIVSFGDSGYAIIHIVQGLIDRPGYDFAVFENGFKANNGYYLELAFVEVSKDGVNYSRYYNESLADTTVQLGFASETQPEFYRNLAGKHQLPYGSLFDLEEVNADTVYYIKLVDVGGSLIDSVASRDSKGRKINDPWPSPFSSCGFDLDALALVDGSMVHTREILLEQIQIFPIPARIGQKVQVKVNDIQRITVIDQLGKVIIITDSDEFYLERIGLYWIKIETEQQCIYRRITIY